MQGIKALLAIAALALFLVACATVGTVLGAGSLAVSPSGAQDPLRSITVVGVGRVSLVPDVAQVSVGADARADTVSEAKAEIDRQMAAIVTALEEMGVDQGDIQTSHYSIYYERESMPLLPEGPTGDGQGRYRVSNMLRVSVRNVEKAGEVLDAVVEAGANQVHGVTFTVSDESKWHAQARTKAIADARARAGELSGLAGVELGEMLSMSEVIGGWPMAVGLAPERSMGGSGIAPGELEMSTQVQVTFAIQ